MPLRVLFVDQSGQLGGAELSLVDIAHAYSDDSEVVLFEDGPFRKILELHHISVNVLKGGATLSAVRRESAEGLGVRALPGVALLALRLAIRARRFDLLYPNTQKALVVAAIAGILARRPVIWHLRDILSPEHFSAPVRRLVILICNFMIARVIANSRASAEAFVEAGGDIRKVRVIHDGLDTALFISKAGTGRPELRQELVGDAPLVGLFSRLSPWKGQEVLLRALAELPKVHAFIVGEAMFGEHEYGRQIRALARDLGVENRAHFLGFRSDIPQLMRTVDIVLHTSTAAEPLGRVIVEGMLANRPVVATAAGGALEIIDDGRTGLFVPPGDHIALTEAISRLLDSPGLSERLGHDGQAQAEQQFGMAFMLVRLRSEIESVL